MKSMAIYILFKFSDVRLCATHFCQHEGTCFFLGNATACLCTPGFTGRFCEDAVQQMHNTCNDV